MNTPATPQAARVRALLDHLDLIAWEAEAATLRATYVSEGLSRILGYAPAAWLAERDFFAAHVHEADREHTLSFCRAVASDGVERRAAFRMIGADDEPRWMELTLRRDVDEKGTQVLDALMIDLSLRREAHGVLESSEVRTRALLEQLPLIVWTTDRALRFSSGAGAGLSKLGLRPSELAGVPIQAYLRGAGRDEEVAVIAARRALEGEASKYDQVLGARTYQVHVEPFRDASGAIIGALGIALDVTERKQAEAERDRLLVEERAARAAAEDAEQRARFLAESSRILADAPDHVRSLRAMARLALGWLTDVAVVEVLDDDDAIVRAPCCADQAEEASLAWELDRVDPLPSTAERLAAIEHAGGAARFGADDELPLHLRPLRQLGWHAVTWAPLVARGRTLGALTFARLDRGRGFSAKDRTLIEELSQRAAVAVDNVRLYREARAAIRLRDEFLSVAAHELRTPCTSLLLGVQSLRRMSRGKSLEAAPPELVDRALSTSERQTRNLARLVDKLLDASRIRGGRLVLEPENVDLVAAARAAIDDMREDAERDGSVIRLVEVTGAGPVVGRWDRLRIEQILVNLLSNALKYGDGKPIEVRVWADAESAILEVRDHGIGVPPDKLPEIFERFGRAVSSANYGGLGLGLYIVRRIVESHGGTIMCEPAPDDGMPGEADQAAHDVARGTLFRVTLPLAGPPAR